MSDSMEEKWDQMAGDYQRVFSLGLNAYNTKLLQFWHESGMLLPGCRVLDVGCGVGKYGTYLAGLGYEVTLTDISPRMIGHARENMARFDSPWSAFVADFNTLTPEDPRLGGHFRLAISTMSPAIHDEKSVAALSAMSDWCFLARFSAWSQPQRDTLLQALGQEPRPPMGDLETDVTGMLQAVSSAGFVPQQRLADYNWCDYRRPEEAAAYLRQRYLNGNTEITDRQLRSVIDHMLDEEGCFVDAVNTKVSWIYWTTEG